MSKKKDIINKVAIETPSVEDVRAYLNALEEKERDRFTLRPQKKSFFNKVKTAWNVLTK